jgi:hypothetical protein
MIDRFQIAAVSRNLAFLRDRPWLVATILITGIFLALNHQLLTGKVAGIWDANNQFVQYHILVADYARAGRLLNWDPWTNGGLPLSGDPQVGAFSPINVFAGFLTGGTTYGFILYWLFMWWLGGFGILMLARHLLAPAWGGCVAALGFLFCGVYTGNAEHTSWLIGFSFLPLVIWRLDAALCSARITPAAEAGALWGLSALAGYPGFTIVTGMYAALWALGRWLCANNFQRAAEGVTGFGKDGKMQRPTPAFMVLSLGAILLVGSVVFSPAYFSFLHEGAGVHSRVSALSRDVATNDNALHPGALTTLTTNYLSVLQQYNKDTLWPYTDVAMSSIYCGAAIFTLGIFALVAGPKEKWIWWVFLLAILSLSCALGQALPVRGWLYDWVYPTRFFRFPAMFRAYYIFSVSVLAIIGTRFAAEMIRKKDHVFLRRFVNTSSAVSALAIVIFLITRHTIPHLNGDRVGLLLLRIPYSTFGTLQTSIAWLGTCGIAWWGWKQRSKTRKWFLPLLLLVLATTDAYLTLKLSGNIMYAEARVERWRQLDRHHSTSQELSSNGLFRAVSSCKPPVSDAGISCDSLNNDQLVTKVPVLNAYATELNYFHQEISGNPVLANMATGASRIWFAREALEAKPSKGNFAALAEIASRTASVPLLVQTPVELMAQNIEAGDDDNDTGLSSKLATAQPLERVEVKSLIYRPDQLSFEVDTHTAGWLLVTDRWARGWSAEVNGVSTTVFGGNFIFRAIKVAAGHNQVTFNYKPMGLPWLVVVSWTTLGLISLNAIMKYRNGTDQDLPIAFAMIKWARLFLQK